MLVFVDPYPNKGHSIHFVPDEDAIAMSRKAAIEAFVCRADALPPKYPNATALADFQTVHWAETIEQVIEKMARAMWEKWHNASSTMMRVEAWNDGETNRDPWREQAKAALKSLGVDVS